MMFWYKEMTLYSLKMKCAKCPKNAIENTTLCEGCTQKNREKARKHYENNKEKKQQYDRTHREQKYLNKWWNKYKIRNAMLCEI